MNNSSLLFTLPAMCERPIVRTYKKHQKSPFNKKYPAKKMMDKTIGTLVRLVLEGLIHLVEKSISSKMKKRSFDSLLPSLIYGVLN